MKKIYDSVMRPFALDSFHVRKKVDYVFKILTLVYVYAMVNFVAEWFVTKSILVFAIESSMMTVVYLISIRVLKNKKIEAAANIVIVLGFGFAAYLYLEPTALRFHNQLLMVLLTVSAGYTKRYQIYGTYLVYVVFILSKSYDQMNSSLIEPLVINQLFTILGASAIMVCIVFLKNTIDRELVSSELLMRQMEYDTLTGLPNRRRFENVFRNGFSDQNIAFLMIDLDHFKIVNDTYGHNVGDQVLKRFSDVLVETIRHSDMAFRWGGEEFAIVLTDVDQTLGEHIAERIRHNVETCDFGIGKSITVSIGMKFICAGTVEEHMRMAFIEADHALYRAKDTGRNRVVVD